MEPDCVSYNLEKQPSGDNGAYKCELNDATHEGNEDDLVGEYDYFYHGSEASVTYKLLPAKLRITRFPVACMFLLTNPAGLEYGEKLFHDMFL